MSLESRLQNIATKLQNCITQISVEEFRKGTGPAYSKVSDQESQIWTEFGEVMPAATSQDYVNFKRMAGVEEYYDW